MIDRGADRPSPQAARALDAVWRPIGQLARSRALPWLLLLLGVCMRVAWLISRGKLDYASGEASNVAMAIARTGVAADAFGPGHGPTAHLTPVMPFIAGTVYRMFGIKSETSEVLLAGISIGLSLGTAGLLYLLFRRTGGHRAAALIGLALYCLLPINPFLEVVSFRAWEGALATLLGATVLLVLLRGEGHEHRDLTGVVALSALLAVLFFISPTLGLGCYAATLLSVLRASRPARWPVIGLTMVAALALVFGPWVLRNQQVMGSPILLRSNFGLELALANHEAATRGGDGLKVFRDRLTTIHPMESQAALSKVKAVGEIRYSQALGEEAKAWIADNPVAFVQLSLKHVSQLFFPPDWFWHIYSLGRPSTIVKRVLFGILSVLGIAGLLLALVRGSRPAQYIAIIALGVCATYSIVQPVPRYRYLLFGYSVYYTGYLVAAIMSRFRIGRAVIALFERPAPAAQPSA